MAPTCATTCSVCPALCPCACLRLCGVESRGAWQRSGGAVSRATHEDGPSVATRVQMCPFRGGTFSTCAASRVSLVLLQYLGCLVTRHPRPALLQQDVLKLGDFGSCRSVYSRQPYTEYISTRWYRAPECLLTDGFYTSKMDMWSAGCVFYEIARYGPGHARPLSEATPHPDWALWILLGFNPTD